MVAGLPRVEGEYVFDHLETVPASLGVPRGEYGISALRPSRTS